MVPNVVGKTLGAAERAIRGHHCTVGSITRLASTTRKKGHVLRERPAPGKHLGHDAKVNLWVGKGPKHR